MSQPSLQPARRRTQNIAVAALMILATLTVLTPVDAESIGGTKVDGTTGVAPDLTHATFIDDDKNGHIDRAVLRFAADTSHTSDDDDDDDREPVIETVRPQDFTVTGYQIKGCVTGTGINCDTSRNLDADGDTLEIELIVEEKLDYDTDAKPAVSYKKGTLADLDGDLMPDDSTVTLIDAAAPVLTGVYGQTGDSSMIAHLTEAVVHIDETVTPLTDLDTTLDEHDVCYSGGEDEASLSHAAGVITVGLDNGTGGTDNLDAADINSATLLGFGDDDGEPTGADCGTSRLEDTAGNDLAAAGDPQATPGSLAINDIDTFGSGTGWLNGVYTDVGRNRAYLIFNGPIERVGGGSWTTNDIQYVNNPASQGGATGITAIEHTAGSNLIELTLAGTVSTADLGSDAINVIGGKVQAAGDADNIMTTTVSGKTLDGTAPATSSARPPLSVNRLQVYPTGALTVDNDKDGILDGIMVLFNGEVDPATLGANADWKARKLNGVAATGAVSVVGVGVSGTVAGCQGGALPAVTNAVYVCIDEAGAYGTATEFLVGHDAATSGLTDQGGLALENFANLRAFDNARPIVQMIETFDADDDGQIDRLKTTFSEPVDDSTFKASEWTAVDFGANNALGGGDDTTYPVTGIDSSIETSGDDNAVLWLQLTESGTPDTEIVPKTIFARGSGGLTDLKGIAPASYDMTDIVADESAHPTSLDKALPVIVKAQSSVGSASMLIQFSEKIGNNAGGTGDLDFGDFVWDNVNNAGVSGINSVDTGSGGTDSATLTLDGVLTSADFSGDKITVNLNSVYDQAAPTSNVGKQVYVGFTDLAGPTITAVKTVDVYVDGTAGSTGDKPDGWIDGLEVTFSEAIDDASGVTNFDLSEWTIKLGGRTIDENSGDSLVIATDREDWDGSGAINGHETGTFDGVDDNTIYLFFDPDLDLDYEGSPPTATFDGWRTDALPTVSYSPDAQDGFMRALDDGAPMAAVSNVASADGAGPVLLTLSGSVDSKDATLTFSEPVLGTGAANAMRNQDLTYFNNGGSSASSIASVSHTANTKTASLTFNAKLDSTDFSGDQVETKASIKDAAGNPSPIQKVGFQDLSPPVLQKVETVDNDGDGMLDHIKLTFSEPIDDGVACANIRHAGVGDPWTVKVGTTTVTPADVVTAIGDTTCLGAHDAILYIQLTETVAHHSGVTPTVSYNALATNAKIVDKASPANKLGAIAAVQATDKAVPVLWDAAGAPNVAAQAATQDLDGDGKIDAYKLIFSEPVKDSTFRTQEWLVDQSLAGDDHIIDASNLGTANDATLLIPFSESVDFDGEEEPGLTYTNIIGFTDMAGNELASLQTAGAITEVDKARPTIVSFATGAGLTIGQVEFSEGVQRNGGGALAVSDFDYVNANGAGAGGLSSVSISALAETGTVNFNVAVTADDLDKDTIAPVTNAIHDDAGNAANFAALSLDGQLADRTPPGQITDLALEALETSIKLTWTTPTANDLDKFDIRIQEGGVAITDATFDSATSVITGTIGDAATLPVPSSGASQSLTITGLDATKTYFFAIQTHDVNGLKSDASNSPSKQPLPADGGIPGDVTGLTVTAKTANSISVEWTAPADDDGDATSGAVTDYVVKVSTTAITAANFDAAADATVTFDPATLAAPGATQKAVVTQIGGTALAADTTYYIAVKAEDEKAQVSATAPTVSAKTDMVDTTAPTGTLAITSSTHVASTATENNDPTFSWSGLTDAESTITYYYVLDQAATTAVTDAAAGSTAGTTASFTDIAPGTWHFHVVGISQGGSSDTAHYEIVIVAPPAVDFTTKLETANQAIRASTTVVREGEDNIVSWTLPETEDEIAGVQIWRSTSPFSMIADLARGDAAFTAGSFRDVDAPEGAVYLVTVYFLAGEAGGQYDDLDNVPGYIGLSDDEQKALGTEPKQDAAGEDDGLPTWAIILIVLGGILIVALIVFLIVLGARRQKDESDSWGDEAAWDDGPETWDDGDDAWDDNGDDAWDEPAAVPAEAHELECPDCNHQFTAHGQKPLTTSCPNCGVKGVLN